MHGVCTLDWQFNSPSSVRESIWHPRGHLGRVESVISISQGIVQVSDDFDDTNMRTPEVSVSPGIPRKINDNKLMLSKGKKLLVGNRNKSTRKY